MHGLPRLRATMAASPVIPPRVVTMPAATFMPGTSSEVVSMRTRMTDLPCAARATASSERKTISPVAVPGLAPIPFASSSLAISGLRVLARLHLLRRGLLVLIVILFLGLVVVLFVGALPVLEHFVFFVVDLIVEVVGQ